jgi:hypothetical protein
MSSMHASILAAVLATALSQASWASTCVGGTSSLEHAYAVASNVVHGKIVDVRSESIAGSRVMHRGAIEIFEVLKSQPDLAAPLTIEHIETGEPWFEPLREGAHMLFFFNGPSVTSSDLGHCAPTRLMAVGDPALEVLRAASKRRDEG